MGKFPETVVFGFVMYSDILKACGIKRLPASTRLEVTKLDDELSIVGIVITSFSIINNEVLMSPEAVHAACCEFKRNAIALNNQDVINMARSSSTWKAIVV